MQPSLDVYMQFAKISGGDFSQSHLDMLGFQEIDMGNEYQRSLPPGVKSLFFDQPRQVENISLELVRLPLDFKMTPKELINKFEYLWDNEKISSTRKIMFAGLCGVEIVTERPCRGTKDHEVFLWVYTGCDSEFQYAIKFHQNLTTPEKLEINKQNILDTASKVLKRDIAP